MLCTDWICCKEGLQANRDPNLVHRLHAIVDLRDLVEQAIGPAGTAFWEGKTASDVLAAKRKLCVSQPVLQVRELLGVEPPLYT